MAVPFLAVRLAGPQRDLLHDDRGLGMVYGEEKPIIADAPPEYALPFGTLESLCVALERVGGHMRKDAGHAFLNYFSEAAKVLLSVCAEPTGPIHV